MSKAIGTLGIREWVWKFLAYCLPGEVRTGHSRRVDRIVKKPVLLILSLALFGLAAMLLPPRTGPKAKAGPRIISIVQLTSVDDATVAGFREAMAGLGYREGVDVVYLGAGAVGSVEALDSAISKHLEKKPDLIFVSSTPAALAVKRLTDGRKKPPVVFAPVNDPLSAGIVADLRHPGGHITGIRLPMGDGLRLKWLVRIVPGVERIYMPYSADDKSALTSLQQASAAAEALGVTLLPRRVIDSNAKGIAEAVAAIPDQADAIFLPRDSRIEAKIATFVAAAERRRLPLSAPSFTQTQAGALFSFGFVHRDIGRQAARLADQIFKGQAPGDLPVEMAENQLAINLTAAGRIGIAIPDDIVRQADYVIR